MKENIELLNLMMKDQENTDEIYRPGPYWQRYQSRMFSSIKKNGISRFRKIPSIGGSWAGTLVKDPFELSYNFKGAIVKSLMSAPFFHSIKTRYEQVINDYIRKMQIYKSHSFSHFFSDLVELAEQHYKIPDTLHGGTDDIVTINNKDYSSKYVVFLAGIFNFVNNGANFLDKKSFMEIGGGIGGTTHLALSLFPNIKKVVYIDIPPVIYISTEYLRHFFPEAVIDYEASRTLNRIEFKDDDRLEIFCLCPWQIPKITSKSVDLLYNSASFSEMTPDIVGNYATHCKKILKADSEIFLVINKKEPHPNLKITMPDKIYNAFKPDYSFQVFEPKWELPDHPIYAFGKRIEASS